MHRVRSLSRLSLWVGCCLIPLVLSVVTVAAESRQQADPTPKGEILQFTFQKSKIFPGTTRTYWVYVPKQYDPKKPACVYVNQDRIQFNAPAVFDDLIHKKEIPVIIGVFIQHGRVQPLSDKAIPRFNRSYEYDGLGDNYARFLLEELLPEAEKKKTSDGRAIRLSKKGNDRCIGGSSSGAICAFTAAWERPNEFSRVFSAIGTYVGLRGGNDYPTLIRKYEPKPIRIFLQDGKRDLNIYGGDWWMANQMMQRALKFSGYEVAHEWGEGGHNGKHATKIFPQAMKFLWKDWPAQVKAGKGNPDIQRICRSAEDWKLVSKGHKFTEGPAVNARGEVFFTDIPNNKIFKIGRTGKVSVFDPDSKRANGLAFGPDGHLYAVAMGSEQILRYDENGKKSVVADGFRGNDLVVLNNGSMYVTNPIRDKRNASKVWYINPKGQTRVVDTGLQFANGVTVSPDQSLLYVADSRSHWIYSYQIQEDGSLEHKQKYYHLHVPDNADDSGADGMCVDRKGWLYVTTRMGLQICDQAGRVHCIIPTPTARPSNVCLGGKNFDVLVATCRDKVYMRKVNVKGANAFQAPIKPKNPRL
ncbi:MAG: SMP-30/gluconolactonase/LRE family protein [Gemmataceae bacterium]